MSVLRSRLTVEERIERHRLIVRDTVTLSTLLAIVIALTFVTYLLFHSFAAYRLKLEERWKIRGETALRNHKPELAIDSLHSALAYAPDDRTLQIELATALAAAGRTQEAVVYFTTLHEAEPGNGMINLNLARLSVTQGNAPMAIIQYQAALDGTWNGDGVVRRREARLELSRYLIAQRRFDEARNQLLIAAGNASDNHALQLVAAGLLEQAEGDADAYTLYRKAMAFSDTRTAGLIGAGRTAAAQSRYLLARNLLQQAVVQPDFAHLPEDERAAVRGLLGEAVAILDVFPAESLPLHARAVRVGHAVQVLRAQVEACAATGASGSIAASAGAPQPKQPQAAVAGSVAKGTAATLVGAPNALRSKQSILGPVPGATNYKEGNPLRSAISAVQHAGNSLTQGKLSGSPPAGDPAPEPPKVQAGTQEGIQTLSTRWRQLPPDAILRRRMEADPAFLESTLQLVYDLEKSEAQLPGCQPPTRDAALLLKIASAPDEIQQQ